MSIFEEAMQIAVQLPLAERERLGRALGLNVHTKGAGKTLNMNQFVARPDPSRDPSQSQAWRQAETGHAVLDTRAQTPDASQMSGPQALFKLWKEDEADMSTHAPTSSAVSDATSNGATASSLSQGAPVILHTDVCVALAQGSEDALRFFEAPSVEIRLATATYLALLGAAQDEGQRARLERFVAPYAVLSLGPMASSRAVELMKSHALENNMNPLDALIAATALAHEIPLLAIETRPFQSVAELNVLRPY